MKNQDVTESKMPRRSFMRGLWIVLGGAALVEAGVVTASFLRPRRTRSQGEERTMVTAGPVERFEPGTVTAFPEGKFYLVRLAGGGFLAVSRRCTHLGCTVPWDQTERRFVCPCHASAYDITGVPTQPPAPRPLDTYPVRIENRIVKVDVSAPIRRQAFDSRQVTRT